MTTINTSDEQILKEDLVKDIYFEGKAVKVYDSIYGLTNLGRSYFCTVAEVMKKADEAETQMMQKYGNEVYGKSAQNKNQSTPNKSSVGNTTGSATSSVSEAGGDGPISGSGGLIHCKVTKLKKLAAKFNEAVVGDYSKMKDALEKFKDWIDNASRSSDWKKQNEKDIKTLTDSIAAFRPDSGPNGSDNQKAWNDINEVLKGQNWVGWMKSDKVLNDTVQALRGGWDVFQGKPKGTSQAGGSGSSDEKDKNTSPEDNEWNPLIPLRIDIQTNFDDNWFKRKFKSGLLNKMIFAIKTSGRAKVSPDANVNDPMANHKYTADEMLPQDVKKLDSIQWKMTNKVAKDYITYLLGWSRDKKRIMNENGDGFKPFVPVDSMEQDSAFGKKMSEKALSNRGILGRLKQQIFAGGQSNNVISVAFQLADPNDGWQLVDEKGTPVEGNGENGENGEGDGADGKNGEGGNAGGAGGSVGGGSNGNGNGSGNGNNNGNNGGNGNGNENGNGNNGGKVDQKDIKSLLTLLQRVERIEDEVGVGPGSKGHNKKQANESTDPFNELADDAHELAYRVCCGECGVDELLEHHLGVEV